MFCLLLLSGASEEEEEDELYERGVVESNCVYRLLENRLVPAEQAWACSPSVSLLGFSEVSWILPLLTVESSEFILSVVAAIVCVSRSWCLILAVKCTYGMDRMFPPAGGASLSS